MTLSDSTRHTAAAGNQYAVRAVQRVLDVFDYLQRVPDGASLGEVAAAVGLPKPSAFRYLATLEERRYVERDPLTGRYQIGLAVFPFQHRSLELLTKRARPYLTALRDSFDESVNLGVLAGERVLYVDIAESRKTVRQAARVGDRDPVHSTALGKAIAARLDDAEVWRLLERDGLPRLTERTITDRDRFAEALAEARARGFAVDVGENEDDGCCVAAYVPLPGVHAAISISVPASRFRPERVEEMAEALGRTAAVFAAAVNVGADAGANGRPRASEPRG